jgi:hypothetical protein
MQFDMFVFARCYAFKELITCVYIYAVIAVHITDTYTLIPVVVNTHIFLLGCGGER